MTIDPKILLELKQSLLNEKKRFEGELELIAKPTKTPDNYTTNFDQIGKDEDENASEIEEYTENIALENSFEKQLKEINDALEKIKNNTYGICENCHSEIPLERLRVYPAAKTCLKC
jgi:RNA polymerase-binding transcription factor DksA